MSEKPHLMTALELAGRGQGTGWEKMGLVAGTGLPSPPRAQKQLSQPSGSRIFHTRGGV